MSILGRKLALIVLLAPLFAFGQGSQLPRYTVATLPAASTQPHYIVQVIDGASSADCTTGGGTQNVLCTPLAGVWSPVAGTAPVGCSNSISPSGILTCTNFDGTALANINTGVVIASQTPGSGYSNSPTITQTGGTCTTNPTILFERIAPLAGLYFYIGPGGQGNCSQSQTLPTVAISDTAGSGAAVTLGYQGNALSASASGVLQTNAQTGTGLAVQQTSPILTNPLEETPLLNSPLIIQTGSGSAFISVDCGGIIGAQPFVSETLSTGDVSYVNPCAGDTLWACAFCRFWRQPRAGDYIWFHREKRRNSKRGNTDQHLSAIRFSRWAECNQLRSQCDYSKYRTVTPRTCRRRVVFDHFRSTRSGRVRGWNGVYRDWNMHINWWNAFVGIGGYMFSIFGDWRERECRTCEQWELLRTAAGYNHRAFRW